MQMREEKTYTIEDIYALPEGQRAELIDGNLYLFAAPTPLHQSISLLLGRQIGDHIDSHAGKCQVWTAPLGVFLNNDETYLEPDLVVVCENDKMDDRGCHGAPDWVIEIVSPSSLFHDHNRKLNLYRDAGVKEYWIVNPKSHSVLKFDFSNLSNSETYRFSEKIPSLVMNGLSIDLSRFNDA